MPIRFARLDERAALEDLQRRASLMWDEDRDALLSHPEVNRLPEAHFNDGRIRVAESSLGVVGFSVMLPVRPEIWELDGLFVDPISWGTGIGRNLMRDGVELARLQNVRSIHVVANLRAEGFYLKFGFARLGSTQTQFGPAARMRFDIC